MTDFVTIDHDPRLSLTRDGKDLRGEASRRMPATIQSVARRKLRYLNSARSLADLRAPPWNMLEALKGNRLGQHSIRINDQWRICVRWAPAGPSEVEIVDYH